MKKLGIMVLAMVLLTSSTVFAQYLEKYFDTAAKGYHKTKMMEIAVTRVEGNFSFAVMPFTLEYGIAMRYPEWKEKRYSYSRMVQESKDMISMMKNANVFYLVLNYTGDISSGGKTEIKIDKDIGEYIFLENDKGEYVQCRKADVPFLSMVCYFNDSVALTLIFPTKFPDTGKSIFKNTKTLIVVVGGLGLKDNRFKFDLPFSMMFQDAPQHIKRLYYDTGLWKK
jgi:hypothetical protein